MDTLITIFGVVIMLAAAIYGTWDLLTTGASKLWNWRPSRIVSVSADSTLQKLIEAQNALILDKLLDDAEAALKIIVHVRKSESAPVVVPAEQPNG